MKNAHFFEKKKNKILKQDFNSIKDDFFSFICFEKRVCWTFFAAWGQTPGC